MNKGETEIIFKFLKEMSDLDNVFVIEVSSNVGVQWNTRLDEG
jgi:hypothetical protein